MMLPDSLFPGGTKDSRRREMRFQRAAGATGIQIVRRESVTVVKEAGATVEEDKKSGAKLKDRGKASEGSLIMISESGSSLQGLRK
jgi:hypothetical protein